MKKVFVILVICSATFFGCSKGECECETITKENGVISNSQITKIDTENQNNCAKDYSTNSADTVNGVYVQPEYNCISGS